MSPAALGPGRKPAIGAGNGLEERCAFVYDEFVINRMPPSGRPSFLAALAILCAVAAAPASEAPRPAVAVSSTPIEFISSAFENASPLFWEIDESGAAQVYLVYDRERSSPNRANGHWHFQVQARPGSDVAIVLNNLENIWNGVPGSVVTEGKTCAISADGKTWQVVNTEALPGERLKLNLHLDGPSIYVARIEPYRISDLERFKAEIAKSPLVAIEPIGRTVEGRDLEIIRVGRADAPNRVLLRARAHAWESGGNWVIEGLVRRLLRDDAETRQFLERYCVYIMPMANKDGVARGRTRFNGQGKDLNRNWDQPADPALAPENHALEKWIEGEIARGRPIALAIDIHNDGFGGLHYSRPDIDPDRYLGRVRLLDELLRKRTWFTEGSIGPRERNPGTLGEGLWSRYRIPACILELNANWIAGLKEPATARSWLKFGEDLAIVFRDFFARPQ
jgi:hypothetical protein